MEDKTIIYEIIPGDTFEIIAKKMGMTVNQLKDFHNQNCGKMEKVWFDNLIGINKLVLPKEFKNSEEILIRPSKEHPPKKYTPKFHSTQYEVVETFSKPLENELEITYKVDIQQHNNSQDNPQQKIIEVKCFDYIKNGEKPDDKMSSIAISCMQCIFPIHFLMDDNGSLLSISNFSQLKNNFDTQRSELEDFYVGEIYQSYFSNFSEILENEDYTNQQLLSSPLYQILFPKLDWFHKKQNWQESLYFIQGSFPLQCEMTADYNHEISEFIETKIKGKITENCSLQEVLNGKRWYENPENIITGNIEILYKTHKKTQHLLNIETTAELFYEEALIRKHHLKINKIED